MRPILDQHLLTLLSLPSVSLLHLHYGHCTVVIPIASISCQNRELPVPSFLGTHPPINPTKTSLSFESPRHPVAPCQETHQHIHLTKASLSFESLGHPVVSYEMTPHHVYPIFLLGNSAHQPIRLINAILAVSSCTALAHSPGFPYMAVRSLFSWTVRPTTSSMLTDLYVS